MRISLAGVHGVHRAERAALELTEQGTRMADAAGGVTDEAWANTAKHYDEEHLAALVLIIGPHQRLQPMPLE